MIFLVNFMFGTVWSSVEWGILDVLTKQETHAGPLLTSVFSYILIAFGLPEKLLVIYLVKKLASCMEPTL
jgi:hypothetical protein